jgi:hypothetical protein
MRDKFPILYLFFFFKPALITLLNLFTVQFKIFLPFSRDLTTFLNTAKNISISVLNPIQKGLFLPLLSEAMNPRMFSCLSITVW